MVTLSRGRRQGGVILISALIVLVFLAVMGLTLIAFVLSRLMQVESDANRLKAFYCAEAGIAASLAVLKQQIDTDAAEMGKVERTPFKDGFYEAYVNPATGIITGIGECRGARREVEIKYKTL